ncbi:hypothetical protein VTL71DRAFT_9376 [Oculimacula yallundae]|uniref:Heterokaryon incompatibility domain-containing protein n=1 Tax=Oculimacula yallundae TaxID=86028 RepID=A0ABR4BT15_9HELO
MQQFIACSKDAFAFGEQDELVLRNYDYLLPEDCLSLWRIRCGITDPKYGYRYKLLWDSIVYFLPGAEVLEEPDKYFADRYGKDLLVALVVIPNGPLFVDVRRFRDVRGVDGTELTPPSGNLHIQLYREAGSVPGGNPEPFLWSAIGTAAEIPADVSTSDLALASVWLKDCISGFGKHEVCRTNTEPPLLPTRVVDIGSSDAETRLHISNAGERCHYVALSHCWGGLVPIMTTNATIHDFVRKLPSEIPKTFADAIKVTRAMGQRYLWIDSLCILQDSGDDWEAEAAKMDQVYSQALFTIVADAAENSSSGFLGPHARTVRKSVALACELPPSTDDINTSPCRAIYARERGDLAFQLPYHDFYPDSPWGGDPWGFHQDKLPIRSKLSTRAWAFQERLLSQRTLHFGPSEMAWECRALCSCECSAINERTGRTTSLLKRSNALQPSGSVSDSESSAQSALRSINDAWQRDIVEEYTRLDLTRDTDRLSALAGIASQASTLRMADQYVGGMWRNTIRESLLWYTTPEQPSTRPLRKDPLPTWSWASVSGRIKHARIADVPNEGSLMEVLDVQYTSDIKSPMGRGPSTPAWLLGSGYLVPIESVWFQSYKDYHEENAKYDYHTSNACYRVKWPTNVALPENCVAMIDVHHAVVVDESVQLDRLDGTEEFASMELVMLLAALSKGVVLGLLLSRRSQTLRGPLDIPEYERVGFVNGMDEIGGDFELWSSTGHYVGPRYEVDWEPDAGVDAILAGAGIDKSTMKIW